MTGFILKVRGVSYDVTNRRLGTRIRIEDRTRPEGLAARLRSVWWRGFAAMAAHDRLVVIRRLVAAAPAGPCTASRLAEVEAALAEVEAVGDSAWGVRSN